MTAPSSSSRLFVLDIVEDGISMFLDDTSDISTPFFFCDLAREGVSGDMVAERGDVVVDKGVLPCVV